MRSFLVLLFFSFVLDGCAVYRIKGKTSTDDTVPVISDGNVTCTQTFEGSSVIYNCSDGNFYMRVTPYNTNVGQQVTFEGRCTNSSGGVETFSWNYGDGSTGTGGQTYHSYSSAGTYQINGSCPSRSGIVYVTINSGTSSGGNNTGSGTHNCGWCCDCCYVFCY